MLTAVSLSYISFINFFMIPIIALKIYYRRHKKEWNWSFDLVFAYSLMCVIHLPIVRICASMVEKLTNTVIHAETTRYTLIALVCAIIIPYVVEIFEQFIEIHIDIRHITDRGEENEK